MVEPANPTQVQEGVSPSRVKTSRGLTAAFAGYDAFVSYARSDSSGYARALQAGLETAGLAVFVDYQAIPPGEALGATLRRGIRRSRMLVVICSPAAVRSPWVALEVAEAVKRGRKIVLVNIDDAYAAASWPLAPDLIWVPETTQALLTAVPSRGIVEEILKRMEHTRRQNIVVRVFAAALILLTALLIGVAWNWRQAVTQRETALAQKLVALAETESRRAPQNGVRATLLLLESLRHHETPEAISGLAESTRVLRHLLASANAGKSISEVRFSPDGSWVAASGLGESGRPSVSVWSADALSKRWMREAQAGDVLVGAGATWTADGRHIVWRAGKNLVEFLASDTGAVVHAFQVPGGASAFAVSPDGKWVAIGSLDGSVTIWDAANRTPAATLTGGRNVLGIAFAPDGRTLAYGGGPANRPGTTAFEDFSLLFVANATDWTAPVQTVRVPGPVMDGMVFSPNSRFLAIPGSLGRMIDVQSLRDLGSFGQGQFVGSVAFSPSGRYLGTATSDRTVRIFDLQKGGIAARFVHDDGVTFAAFSNDERTVATSGDDRTARLWRIAGGNPTEFSEGAEPEQARMVQDDKVRRVRFDPTGRRLLTGASDGHLQLWSVSDTTFRWVTNEALLDLAISPDGRWLVTAGSDYHPGLWDLSSDTEPRRLAIHENDLSDAAFSADGRWLATADDDSVMQLFRTDTFQRVARLKGRQVAFGRDEVVAYDGGGPLRRYRVPSGDVLEEIPVSAPIASMDVSAANMLALGMRDGTVVIRDLASRPSIERARVQHGKNLTRVAFTPRGDLLATAGADGAVRLWRMSGELHQSLTLGESVSAIAFDRTGGFLAAGGRSGSVVVWSLSSEAPVARFGGSQQVVTLAFTPAGHDVLFIGGYNGFRSTLWRAADLLREACTRLPRRVLTPDEWRTFVQPGDPIASCDAGTIR
jgi:WD40 repeat protein